MNTVGFAGRPALCWVAALMVSMLAGNAVAAEATRSSFGVLADGRKVETVVLRNGSNLTVRIMTLGAAVQAIEIPNRRGGVTDVVLGFETPQEYVRYGSFFGATVGRFANRIAKARFSLDGREYVLGANDHGNSLHGGAVGFDKVLWRIASVSSGSEAVVVLAYRSPDGDGGYPGNLDVTARYSLDEHDVLRVTYEATTDKPTVVNISNHSYFNLAGAGHTAMDHVLTINASRYTPVDEQLIPTSELREVAGTPFDFRKPTVVGDRVRDGHDPQLRIGRGYDHNFVLEGKAGEMRLAARVMDPRSGRVMEIHADAPGFQFYSGNFLDSTISGKGVLFREGDALVFEPQLFPDAPNQPGFASARLEPGSVYRNSIEYRFSGGK